MGLLILATVVVARGRGEARWPFYEARWGGDEERMVFVSARAGRRELYDMRPSGADVRRLDVGWDSTVAAAVPSPDGTKYMVMGTAGPTRDEVLVVSANGDTVNVSRSPKQDFTGAWAPDGSALVFSSFREGHSDLYEVAPDGSELRPLTEGVWDDDRPCWSPDGGAIAYRSSHDGPRELWIMDADGRRPRRLATLLPTGCRFSPDGRWIAFTARTDAGDRVFVVGRDGTGLMQVGQGGGPVWSPDGEWLTYGGTVDGVRQVVRVRRDGSMTENVSRDTAEAYPLAWLPERTRYVQRVAIGRETAAPLTVGEKRALRARAYDAADRYYYGAELRWESTNPAVATVDSTGTVRGLTAGSAGIVATLGGWRADTLQVRVVPPSPRLLFRDSFDRGLDSQEWDGFGTPAAYVGPRLGVGGSGGFVANGDDDYESGAATRRRFPTANGLTVELAGRAPLTGRTHQVLAVDLATLPLDTVARRTGAIFGPQDTSALRFAVQESETGVPQLVLGSRRVPFPGDPGAWHRYRVQLRPDGWGEVFVDDKAIVASPPVSARVPASVRVVLGYRSWRTTIVVDEVSVWEGLRAASP